MVRLCVVAHVVISMRENGMMGIELASIRRFVLLGIFGRIALSRCWDVVSPHRSRFEYIRYMRCWSYAQSQSSQFLICVCAHVWSSVLGRKGAFMSSQTCPNVTKGDQRCFSSKPIGEEAIRKTTSTKAYTKKPSRKGLSPSFCRLKHKLADG